MRQVWISKAGPPEVLEIHESAEPLPRSGEVRIRVEAAGVNFADLMGRMGAYNAAPAIPYVPGYEVSGVVDIVGQGVPDLEEGDRVLALTRFGGYSEAVCVPYRQVFKRFDWMSAQDGAAIPVNYLTAYMMLIVMGSLRPADRVLIHGAGGGVGLAALDICTIMGAETFGTASPHKHEFLRGRGLKHPIDYRNQDFEEVVSDLTADRGVQVILDPQGGRSWWKNYRLLSPSGRLIHYGINSGVQRQQRSWLQMGLMLLRVPFYTPIKLMLDNKSVAGVDLAGLWEHTDMVRPWMAQIMSWYDEALFRPHVDKTFSFKEAAEAHQYLHERKNLGKVLLTP